MPTRMGKGRGRHVTQQNIPCSELTVLTSVSTIENTNEIQGHSVPSPELAAGHFQSISYHLELIVLFLYLCKKKFQLFCAANYKWERGILSSTSTVSIPNWSVHCFTVAKTLRSRWSTASRCGSDSTGEMGSWAMADFKADFSTPFFR